MYVYYMYEQWNKKWYIITEETQILDFQDNDFKAAIFKMFKDPK